MKNWIVSASSSGRVTRDGVEVQPEKKLPSVPTMAKNLATAVGQHILSGAKRLTEEDAATRWDTCLGCDKLLDESRCSLCGCFMKTKTTWAEQKCPIGKW